MTVITMNKPQQFLFLYVNGHVADGNVVDVHLISSDADAVDVDVAGDDDDGGDGDDGCCWHAADTAPLEGLPILRCAIYDPLDGLQISKMRLAQMGV